MRWKAASKQNRTVDALVCGFWLRRDEDRGRDADFPAQNKNGEGLASPFHVVPDRP